MITYGMLVKHSLKLLSTARGDADRAIASRELCELGVIFAGTTPSGIDYVVPASHWQRLFPDWKTAQREFTLR